MSSLGPTSGMEPIQSVGHTLRTTHADPDKKREQQQQHKKNKPHDEVELTSNQDSALEQTADTGMSVPDTDDEPPPVIHIDVQG